MTIVHMPDAKNKEDAKYRIFRDNVLMKILPGIFLLGFLLAGCSFYYVAKQGVYQLKLLANAEPIEKALRSPEIAKNVRHKLMLISEVRDYCRDKLHLKVNSNYKDVNLSWNHILYNVSASEPLAFKPYIWWFPIIGNVPYKGFFDEKDADAQVLKLESEGFETLKRRVGGYSTLGYFSDPVWPTMLEMSDESLTELIIHELTHATYYIPYETPFNETLANFVGKTGAHRFFVDKFGENSEEVKNLDRSSQDEKSENDFFFSLYQELDNLYNSARSDQEKLSLKAQILGNAKKHFLQLPINPHFKNIEWSRVNNAFLLAFKTYNQDESVFVDLLKHVHGDFEAFFTELGSISQGQDPFLALRQYLKEKSHSNSG